MPRFHNQFHSKALYMTPGLVNTLILKLSTQLFYWHLMVVVMVLQHKYIGRNKLEDLSKGKTLQQCALRDIVLTCDGRRHRNNLVSWCCLEIITTMVYGEAIIAYGLKLNSTYVLHLCLTPFQELKVYCRLGTVVLKHLHKILTCA